MNNFLVAALIVFLVSMIIFSAVFIMAVRLRLLPAQPEVKALVDRFFLFNFFRSKSTNGEILVTATSAGIWVLVKNEQRFSFASLSTVAVATIIMSSPIEVPPSVSVEIGCQLSSKNALHQAILPQPYFIMKTPASA